MGRIMMMQGETTFTEARMDKASIQGFLISLRLNAMNTGKIRKVLLANQRFNGVLWGRADFIEHAVRIRGARVGHAEGGRALVFPNGNYIRERDLNATLLNYADYLVRERRNE